MEYNKPLGTKYTHGSHLPKSHPSKKKNSQA